MHILAIARFQRASITASGATRVLPDSLKNRLPALQADRAGKAANAGKSRQELQPALREGWKHASIAEGSLRPSSRSLCAYIPRRCLVALRTLEGVVASRLHSQVPRIRVDPMNTYTLYWDIAPAAADGEYGLKVPPFDVLVAQGHSGSESESRGC